MKKYVFIILSVVILGFILSCDVAETDQTAAIEAAIMGAIAADDSTYGIDGMGNIEEEDYTLGKLTEGVQSATLPAILTFRDSNYVWRFGRTGMQAEREITIEVEDDSSAQALISHHITGLFHVRQFLKVWIDEHTWVRGDSVRFSEKPIDMTAHRRVAFRKRLGADGEERWIPTAMTLVSGQSGATLGIESVEWVAEDSVLVLSDFDTVFYNRFNPLVFSFLGQNRLNVQVSNDVPDEMEIVTGRFGFNPRVDNPDMRVRIHMQYMGTSDTGEKVYSRRIMTPMFPRRHFKGFIEVLDYRTLFDHEYETYSSATLGFIYTTRDRVRP